MQLPLPFMPEQASTFAGEVDALYLFLVGLTGSIVLAIAILEVIYAIKYRRRSPDEVPAPIKSSLKLELTWTITPLLIVLFIFTWGASLYFKLYRAPEEALELYLTAKQWMWRVQHPNGQREINELHIPIGRRVKLTMATEDVIHSFYVPAFRIKMDVVPGRYTTTWFEATKPGRYRLFCAEYCGTSHSGMIGWVVAMEPNEYQTWLSGGSPTESLAARGERLFQAKACNSCHRSDGTGRGPALEGLFGSMVKLQTGATVKADEAYLRESILTPSAKMVAGFPANMPTFQGLLSEEEVLQLIAYIKSLSPRPATSLQAAGGAASAASPAVQARSKSSGE